MTATWEQAACTRCGYVGWCRPDDGCALCHGPVESLEIDEAWLDAAQREEARCG